jgi:hypothetical protein
MLNLLKKLLSTFRSSRSIIKNNNESTEKVEDLETVVTKWWSEIFTPDCECDLSLSGKFVLLDEIIKSCKEKNDKLLDKLIFD